MTLNDVFDLVLTFRTDVSPLEIIGTLKGYDLFNDLEGLVVGHAKWRGFIFYIIHFDLPIEVGFTIHGTYHAEVVI